ncbi:hypothetical protein SCP_1403470 [Sparassis crispa]|uniref:Uncharacterized protein n=1 Tax=Sparassis crispa TaxID=139825 RepID=A0A401H3H5_9APHY|nr:hypothetical protein SCP_1403470 [Sparassis crispa]GBE88939.1 hypothetical protein SCP_1403470 [Sparassis crispa]
MKISNLPIRTTLLITDARHGYPEERRLKQSVSLPLGDYIDPIIPSGCLCTREDAHLVDRGSFFLPPPVHDCCRHSPRTARPGRRLRNRALNVESGWTAIYTALPPHHLSHQHLPYVQEETLAPLGASSEDMEHRVEQAKLGLRYHQRRTSTPLDARAVHLTIVGNDTRTKHRDGRRHSPHLRCTHAATPWIGRTGSAHFRAS